MDALVMLGVIVFMSAIVTLWFLYSVEQRRWQKKWATVLTAIALIVGAYFLYSWNTKDCSEYLIEDYQRGEVPVSCVGTYNTVPKSKNSLYD